MRWVVYVLLVGTLGLLGWYLYSREAPAAQGDHVEVGGVQRGHEDGGAPSTVVGDHERPLRLLAP